MLEKLRRHWQTLTITILLLFALSPSPIALPFLHPLQKAHASLKLGNLEIAISQLEEALEFERALAGLHLKVAGLAFDVDDIDKASAHLDALEIHRLPSHEAYCLRQRVNIRRGEFTGLDNDWQGLIINCPESISAIEQLAFDRLASNNLDETLPIFEALAKTASLNTETEEAYAYALAALAPADSLPLLHTLARRADQTPLLAIDLILAIESAASELSPTYSLAQVGQTFARHGRWKLAISSLERALEIDPDFHIARAYLGLSKDQTGQNGLDDLLAATDALPDQALPQVFLALHWLNAGMEEQAREALTVAAQLDPLNPAIAAQLGEVYIGLGDFVTASAAYRQAAALDPKNPAFWLLLARFSNQYEVEIRSLALPAARNAVALNTGETPPLAELAYSYLLLGNNILAERFLWRAVELDPYNAQSQYYLGLLFDSRGDRNGAWAAMQLASSLNAPERYQALAKRWLEGAAR
ncbi:MAG: tetratricopeptide repeat protein [Anaerolineales bacterium]|nr:tetratricopeptide repeat protein [Anaerolineales bacterium]